MKRIVMHLLVLLVALSLAACTTSARNQTGTGINNPVVGYHFNAPADN